MHSTAIKQPLVKYGKSSHTIYPHWKLQEYEVGNILCTYGCKPLAIWRESCMFYGHENKRVIHPRYVIQSSHIQLHVHVCMYEYQNVHWHVSISNRDQCVLFLQNCVNEIPREGKSGQTWLVTRSMSGLYHCRKPGLLLATIHLERGSHLSSVFIPFSLGFCVCALRNPPTLHSTSLSSPDTTWMTAE